MPNRAKWDAERRALKKVQVHFSFTAYATRRLKYEAVNEDMTPSNLVRKLVGLSFEPSTRQRIGLSLTDEDFKILSTRYGVAESDKVEIKRRITEEVNLHYHDKNKAKG
jgi:hypothetical protein